MTLFRNAVGLQREFQADNGYRFTKFHALLHYHLRVKELGSPLNWLGIVLEATLPHLIKNLTTTTTRKHARFDKDIMNGDYVNRACEASSRQSELEEEGVRITVNPDNPEDDDKIPSPYKVGACQFESMYEIGSDSIDEGWYTYSPRMKRAGKRQHKPGSVHWLCRGTDNWRCQEAVKAVNTYAKESHYVHVKFFTDISMNHGPGGLLIRYRCHPNYLPVDQKKAFPWFDWLRYADLTPNFSIGRIVVFAMLQGNDGDGTTEKLVCVVNPLQNLRPDTHIPFSAAGSLKDETPLRILSFEEIQGPICVVPSPTATELKHLLEDGESSFKAHQATTFVTVPPRSTWSEIPMMILNRLLVK
jgi:hypothetical protein